MTATKPLGYSDDATPAGSPPEIIREALERAAGHWFVLDVSSGRRLGDQRGYLNYRDAQEVGDAHFRETKKPVEYQKLAVEAPAKRIVRGVKKLATGAQALGEQLAAARAAVARLEQAVARSRPAKKAKRKAKRTPVRDTGEAQVTPASAHVPGHTHVRSTRTRRARRAVERPATLPVAEGIASPVADEVAE